MDLSNIASSLGTQSTRKQGYICTVNAYILASRWKQTIS